MQVHFYESIVEIGRHLKTYHYHGTSMRILRILRLAKINEYLRILKLQTNVIF